MTWIKNLKVRFIKWIVYNISLLTSLDLTSKSFIHPSVKLRNVNFKGTIIIDEKSKIFNGVIIKSLSSVKIGRFTTITGPNTDIFCAINKVSIGSFCSIARNVSIQEYNHKFNLPSTYNLSKNVFQTDPMDDLDSRGSIEIGNDVWIGTQSVILGGAKIGNGAIIAANSVVLGDIPPYAIAGGSPAKVIKYRFSAKNIEKLLEMNWWDWDVEKIKENSSFFKNKITDSL